jgi:hypothetical protein
MDAIFTIVAKNYIGLAQVLERSVAANSNSDFYIVVADEFDTGQEEQYDLPGNILIAKNKLGIDNGLWEQMAFKYSLVEFCTAIKPACFQYFFEEKKYDKVIYLDPDIYVFNSPQPVFDILENAAIVLTPHITTMQTPFKGDYPDHLFLLNGTFNLGFLALRRSAEATQLLQWWHNRLQNECFSDNERGTLTDQKWMTLLPSFFAAPALHISLDKGLNVAPWNYFERKVMNVNGKYFVTAREDAHHSSPVPLIFVHFSGYDYRSFSTNLVAHKKDDFRNYDDLAPVFEEYAAALKNGAIERFMAETYSYNHFANGVNILSIQRRIYRRLLDEGKKMSAPFSIEKNSYYHLLESKGLLDYSKTSADKVTNKTIPAFEKKLKFINTGLMILKKLAGIRKYSMFMRFLKRYAREENQVFLIDKELGKKMQ